MRVIEKKKKRHLEPFRVDVAVIDPKRLCVDRNRSGHKHGLRDFNRRLCSEIMADDAKTEDTKLWITVFF